MTGKVTWSRYRHTVVAHLDISEVRPNGDAVRRSPVNGQLEARWDSRAFAARASIDDRLGGQRLLADLRAP